MIFSYLVYGLSFFLLWIVLLLYNASLSKYSLVRKLWLLSLFAITHGLHDWISVFITLEKYQSVYLSVFSLGLLVSSFYFLIQFGVSSGIFGKKYRFQNAVPLAFFFLWCAATAASSQKLLAGDVFARYFLGFPGSVMASYALFARQKEEKGLNAALTRNMIIAAASFLSYAFFAGFIVPPADFFPASTFNYAAFADRIGVPVHLFRAICIIAITYALSQVFYIFDKNLRDSLEREKEALEDSVRERTLELMRSNELLQQGEKRYRQLFENMQEGFLIQDVVADDAGRPIDVRYLDINPAMERFLGQTRAEIIGRTRNQVLGTPDPEVAGAISRVADTGQPFHMVRYSSGAKRWYESFSYSLGPGLVATLVLDITERKQAEVALQRREKQLAESQRIAHIGSWERNLETGDMFWSDELLHIFGLDPNVHEVDFKIFSDMIHPDDWPALKKAIDDAIQFNKPYSIDYRIILKDGTTRILHAQAELRRDETDTQSILRGTGQDITERKLAEEKVRQSEAKYRHLFESATDGIFILDLDGNFIDINNTAYTRLGYTKEEMLALHISKLDPPEFAPRVPERIRQVRERGFAVFESAHLRKDGTAMPVEINSRLIEYEGRTVLLSVIRDITERKQAEQALQEKTRQLEYLTGDLEKRVAEEIAVRIKNERMMIQQSKLAAMGEMLGAIAHQWRQPLNVVGLIVQRMEDAHARGKLDTEHLKKMVEKAMKQIERMSKTIDDFRNFYKPDKEKTIFDAMRAVGDVLTLVSAQLAADNIGYRLACHTHGKTFENEADVVLSPERTTEGFRNEFEHVILNLVNNARDAIIEKNARGNRGVSERGLLSFDFYGADGKVIIKVSDNGGGIPPEAMGSIFSPYFTTKDPSKGTGLGLYMSKVIVEDHMQGKLSAENGNGGAIFTIELPQKGKEARHEITKAV